MAWLAAQGNGWEWTSQAKNPQKPQRARCRRAALNARGGQARAIADLMPDIGRTAFRRFGFVQSKRGDPLARDRGARTRRRLRARGDPFPPGEKSDGILQLVVSPAFAPQISMMLPEIVERVNRFWL
jgi:hypothetical protein